MKVELIAHTPCPDDVCDVGARVCVSQDMPALGDGKKSALKGALKSGHESVIEHASFTFSIEGVSRALTHQLVRHRLASYSQQSQRYVNMEDFEYVSPVKNYEIPNRRYAWGEGPFDRAMNVIRDAYKELIELGWSEEDARYILPNACTTNIIVTMNARELRHFFSLRCCTRAQWEIRDMANMMLEQVKEVAPTLFANAGPSCVQLGYCPEKKGCGKVKKSQEKSD